MYFIQIKLMVGDSFDSAKKINVKFRINSLKSKLLLLLSSAWRAPREPTWGHMKQVISFLFPTTSTYED